MQSYPFRLVNVFTRARAPLTGNQLCVFERADGLDADAMQALARQFNLSETTFILPSTRASAAVRIFTPYFEMPFAGHPTLGTAAVCRALELGGDALTLEMPAGIIPVRFDGALYTLEANEPTWRECDVSRAALAASLGLEAADILDRPLWVNCGTEQLVVPIANAAAMRRAAPRSSLLETVRGSHQPGQIYLFAMESPTSALARFFFPQGGLVAEDPATGSATANFGGWHLAMGAARPLEIEISQGEQVLRPSRLVLTIGADGRVRVSGEVIEIGRGTISL
jgi:trans-2,3-dihydro-3-hydroxyanthranilate isomerase